MVVLSYSWANNFEEVVRMASLTVGKSRNFFVVALVVMATAAALLSPDAWASIVEYFRGGGLELFTP